jgi:hypothetical protein
VREESELCLLSLTEALCYSDFMKDKSTQSFMTFCAVILFLMPATVSMAQNADQFFQQGSDLQQQHKYKEAIAAFTRAIELIRRTAKPLENGGLSGRFFRTGTALRQTARKHWNWIQKTPKLITSGDRSGEDAKTYPARSRISGKPSSSIRPTSMRSATSPALFLIWKITQPHRKNWSGSWR